MTERKTESILLFGFWLIGAPAILAVLYFLFVPVGQPAYRFSQVERWIEPLAGLPFDHVGFAKLEYRPLPEVVTDWRTVSLPDVVPLPAISETSEKPEMARAWYRLRYTPPAGGSDELPLALYGTRLMGGAYTVWLDGHLLESSLEDWRMQWNKPLMLRLPVSANVPGKAIDIYLGIPYRVAQGYAVGSFYIGPVSSIRPLFDRRVFLQESLPRAALLVSLLLGLMSFHVWLARRSETPHLLLALTSVAWFIANLQFFVDFSSDEIVSRWFGAIVDAAISWMLPLIYLFAFRFDNRRFPALEKILVGYASVVSVVTLPLWDFGVTALLLHHYLDLVMAIGVTGLVTWLAIRGGSLEFRVVCFALWAIPIAGTHDLMWMTSQQAPDSIFFFPYSTFVVFGAFLFSIQRRYIHAIDEIESVNASLDARLRDREIELEAKHRELSDASREKALLQERQRLMRDMHDGIGSRLISSLAVIDSGCLDSSRIAGVLRECMDDLKLVIDSLEPIAHDLVTLLATLRFRLGGRMELAGIRIYWDVDDLPPLPWLEPPEALEILHILQEALTNVLKHAKASEVRISTRNLQAEDGVPSVVVTISDNGVGIRATGHLCGRGLKNMHDRAGRLQGRLTVAQGASSGTVVSLELPNLRQG